MRTSPAPMITIVGAGRAGCSLAAALEEAHHPVRLVTRTAASAAAARAEGFELFDGALEEAVSDSELVFLAVSDSALASVAQALAPHFRPDALLVHLSGALDLSPLQPSGARLGSLHPLVSIPTRRTALSGGWCAVEAGDERGSATLLALAQTIGLKPLRPRGDRARYHAAACLVGNYPQVLMAAAVRLLAECGIEEEEARQALGALLLGASRNAAALPPLEALTGPVARGDLEVVKRHLASLAPIPDIDRLYRAGAAIAGQIVQERHPRESDELEVLIGERRE